ncbi:AraC family transcriptional regulator [Sphingomonas sp. QA11]|uniref:helix-turn-helix domain-containing protein n=1 Tax=Sphingomonas sp. QA11 TaxID=2950605 RepID=UPI0023496F27|nr:AraC family transcriptional regulator [Sphingomonas sp. QA11]WCM27418.1 AraC family transcriptional regulator [Sphingomonas sp. QA11]
MTAETIILSGRAEARVPAIIKTFHGGSLMVADVVIDEHVAYTQHCDRHLVHATLNERSLAGGQREQSVRRGALSFSRALHDRAGAIKQRHILGLEIGLVPTFVEAACEQSMNFDSRHRRSDPDNKAFVLAESLGAACCQRATTLTCDMLALAFARRVGTIYGGAIQRRDDGWLHPKALIRVIEAITADPVGVSLSKLAQEAGLGISAFVRAFRGSTGTTPVAFALDVRIGLVTGALRESELSVAEIAASMGFASASHLVRIFSARQGMTPGRWRQQRMWNR